MKYIKIQNIGTIEDNAFKLLGASTKRNDDDKIGFFGSGIKYAISYLLRNDIFFRIYSCVNKIEFETKSVTLRDQEFQQIYINGNETSITTSWGENWDKWQIFRELVSNAFDENEYVIEATDDIVPVYGTTQIYLRMVDFEQYYNNFKRYFNTYYVQNNKFDIIDKNSLSELNVYKKGIRIIPDTQTNPKMSLFDYNLPDINLTEERLVESYTLACEVAYRLTRTDNKNAISKVYKQIINRNHNLFEIESMFGSSRAFTNISNEWKEYISKSEYFLVPDTHRNFYESKGKTFIKDYKIKFIFDHIYTYFVDKLGTNFQDDKAPKDISPEYEILTPTYNQKSVLDRILNKLSEVNIECPYQIFVVRFTNNNQIGMAVTKNMEIMISEKVFDKSDEYIVSTLLEEIIHLKYKVDDYTRQFQDAALDLFARTIMGN